MTALDDLHTTMGRFLTESSQVENMMMAIFVETQKNRPMQEVFIEFMDETFGEKIKKFKKACDLYKFSDAHRALLSEAYSELDVLLPKRNFIVHGSTYEMAVRENPTQPYRIGITRGNHDFLSRAIASDMKGPHVFTTAGISAVTEDCIRIRAKLATVVIEIAQASARKK